MSNDHADHDHEEIHLEFGELPPLDTHGDEHIHAGESVWEDAFSIATDPPHLVAEVGLEIASYVVFGLILTPFIKRWVRRHDRKHHDHICERDD